MNTLDQLRKRSSLQIIIFNFLLILVSVVYYLMGGFDLVEISSLITLLTAVSAIYVGALFQFIGKQIKNQSITQSEPTKHDFPFASTLRWIIPGHFMLLFLIISAKAFTLVNFQEMNLFLALIEGSFGGFIGYIVNALFNTSEKGES